MWNSETKSLGQVSLPFLLPHEVLEHMFAGAADISSFVARSPGVQALSEDVCRQLKLDPAHFVGIGLHGDGVPHQKRGSIECISWNVLAKDMGERLPFCVIDKKFVCKCGCGGQHTLWPMPDIFVGRSELFSKGATHHLVMMVAHFLIKGGQRKQISNFVCGADYFKSAEIGLGTSRFSHSRVGPAQIFVGFVEHHRQAIAIIAIFLPLLGGARIVTSRVNFGRL